MSVYGNYTAHMAMRARLLGRWGCGAWRRGLKASACLCVEEDNPFYTKYQKQLERQQGPDTRRAKVRAQVKAHREAASTPSRPPPSPHPSYVTPPSLGSVMHVEKIVDKSSEEISEIWKEYHMTKDSICAAVPADTYVQIVAKALHCPMFVFPLPRDDGFEFFLSTFSAHRCYFTSLINYQLYQENAPVCLTLTHYTDLQDSKGLVLMSGEVDTNILSSVEAQFLGNQLLLYYGTADGERYRLLREFNHSPQTFDHQTLIDQLQNSGIQLNTS